MLALRSRSPQPDFAFLALHGALLDGRSLLPVGEILAERADGLIPDLAGHGLCSDHQPPAGRYDPAALAAELASRSEVHDWLAALPPERPLVLLGHSLGALCALALAVEGPFRERFDHVILLDPPLLLDLGAPGQGELLFDLGCAIGSLAALDASPQAMAIRRTVEGLTTFFLEQFRDQAALLNGRQQLRWLRQVATGRPCHLLFGLQQQVRFSDTGGRLDFGSLVAGRHLPGDLPLLQLHPIADAGHRLDASPMVRRVLAELLPGFARASRRDATP